MAEMVHEFATAVRGSDHCEYKARAFAEKRGNVWVGWLEFVGPRGTRKTGEETSQPDRDAVAYWASGIEPVYLDGAWHRAR
jgi:hypothetical protein